MLHCRGRFPAELLPPVGVSLPRWIPVRLVGMTATTYGPSISASMLAAVVLSETSPLLAA